MVGDDVLSGLTANGGNMKVFPKLSGKSVRKLRRRLKLSQQAFWGALGITQSGGSRYEGGQVMSKPVRELLRIVHVEGIPTGTLRGPEWRLFREWQLIQQGMATSRNSVLGLERRTTAPPRPHSHATRLPTSPLKRGDTGGRGKDRPLVERAFAGLPRTM